MEVSHNPEKKNTVKTKSKLPPMETNTKRVVLYSSFYLLSHFTVVTVRGIFHCAQSSSLVVVTDNTLIKASQDYLKRNQNYCKRNQNSR